MAAWPWVSGALLALTVGASAIAAPAPSDSALTGWRAAVTASAHRNGGCYEANYPDTTWRPIACGASMSGPSPRAPVVSAKPLRGRSPRPLDESVTGNRTALSAGIISSATGTFPQIFNVTQAAGFGATNSFTIQMNTNGFAAPLCKNSHNTGCVGAEQFVIDSGGSVNIQTWLVGYLDTVTTKCPNSTWAVSNNSAGVGVSCWQRAVQTNSKTNDLPVHTFNQLQSVTLQGIAASNGQDSLVLTVGGKATTISIPANFNFGLAGRWTDVDFNVYGESNNQVVFNKGAVINVVVSVVDNSSATPSCAGQGIGGSSTVETSNLTLGPCDSFPTFGALAHGITFWEGVPPVVTSVQPSAGPESGGTLVTIGGQGLSKSVSVKFGGTYSARVTNCDGVTTCQAVSPAGSGSVPITVANVTPIGGEGPFSATDSTKSFGYQAPSTGTTPPKTGPVKTPTPISCRKAGLGFAIKNGKPVCVGVAQ